MARIGSYLINLARVGVLTAPFLFLGTAVIAGVTYGWPWMLPVLPAVLLVAVAWAWWLTFIGQDEDGKAGAWWMAPAGVVLWWFLSPFALLLPIAGVVIVGEAFGWRWWGLVAAAVMCVSPPVLDLVPDEGDGRLAAVLDRSLTLPIQTSFISFPLLVVATELYVGLAYDWRWALFAAGPLFFVTPPLRRTLDWRESDEDE